jgi:hypothetical protein
MDHMSASALQLIDVNSPYVLKILKVIDKAMFHGCYSPSTLTLNQMCAVALQLIDSKKLHKEVLNVIEKAISTSLTVNQMCTSALQLFVIDKAISYGCYSPSNQSLNSLTEVR